MPRMYIRLQQGKGNPSIVDEAVTIVREGLAPMKQRPGFQSVYIGVNRENGHGVIISTWDTEEHASYAVSPVPQPRLQALGWQPEPLRVFEVTNQI